jgi:hypothetical protein
MKVRTFAQAGAYVERVGFCVLFPIKGLPLPSLWAGVKGRSPKNFTLVAAWDADAEKLWGWKDDFPKRRLAWYGKYFCGKASLISPAFLPCFYCLEENTGTPDGHEQLYAEGKITADARAICGELLEHGPQGVLELRHALGWASKRGNQRFKRALEEGQRRLLVVRWGTKPETNAWESAVYQLTPRAFPRAMKAATKLTRPEAQRTIAAQYFKLNPHAGERDLVRVFKWPRTESRVASSAVS